MEEVCTSDFHRAVHLIAQGWIFEVCVFYDYWYSATTPKVKVTLYSPTKEPWEATEARECKARLAIMETIKEKEPGAPDFYFEESNEVWPAELVD